MLFKHKWKIVLLTALAAAAAANVYFRSKLIYESEAKLMVRYVVDRSAIDSLDSQPKTPGTFGGDSITNAEMEILTSWDLAEQVADAIGVERLAPGGDKAAAAHNILSGFDRRCSKGKQQRHYRFIQKRRSGACKTCLGGTR